jgi:winged helix DNA-binding protein
MKQARSTTTRSNEVPFSSAQIHAFRLQRHHLLDRSSKDLVTICRDVCGVQAQIMSAAQLQLWARNHAITPAAVNDALWKTRSLVKTTLMRQTLHLVPADEFPLYIAAQRRTRVASVMARMAKFKITPEEAHDLSDLILESLAPGPLPRFAITRAVRPKVSRRVQAWATENWSMVRLPVAEGLICYGPGEGNQATFIRTDQWLPQQPQMDGVQAQKELLRRYLRSYGPATLKDFAHWSGISMVQVRALRPLLDAELVEQDGLLILREDVKALESHVSGANSVHLLPYFDVYLLAHSFKDHFLAARHYKRVYRNQGWISPVVLINGEIAGVWSYQISGRQIDIAVELFERTNKTIRAQIAAQANALGDLFQRTASISFKS